MKLSNNFFVRKFIITIIFIFFNMSFLAADEKENQLNKLFQELKIKNNPLSSQIEKKIWKLWSTHRKSSQLTTMLSEGSDLVSNKKLNEAIIVFSKIIEIDPNWAEAWNKRATVFYMVGEFQKSQNDINKVLELEKRHFGALAGQGLVNIRLKNYEKAIISYKKAEQIYPSMSSAKIMIRKIKEMIKKETI